MKTTEEEIEREDHMNIARSTYFQREPSPFLFLMQGKKAIVTGGSNGLLGPIWSETLRDAGAQVLILDLPNFDVSRDTIADACNPVDILVNNAGIDNPPSSQASFFGNFSRIMEVNIGGAARMAEQVIPGMIENGGGVIINIGG